MAQISTMMLKSKNRDCANKIRYGSPKLRKVLRENCRQRMREKRNQLFNNHRFGLELRSSQVQDTLTEIVRQEFDNLMASDWNDDACHTLKEIDELLYQEEAIELEKDEIIQEQEQWIFHEYEKMWQEIEFLAMCADNEDREVFCPMCQKAILIEENNCVICTACKLRLAGHTTQEVKYLVNESVNVHALTCSKMPVFITIPDNNNINLYVICHDCSTLSLIC